MSDKRAPFPYIGGKARHADWIVAKIPESPCYVEPFGGAAAVLCTKSPALNEIYNDANGDLVQFFRVLRDRPDGLVAWLRDTPYSRELHERFTDAYYAGERSDDPVVRAGRFFFLRYSQWGGKIGSRSGFATRKDAPSQAGSYANARDTLREFADRFDGVTIEHLDWRECIERYDGPDTVFYCDPPYVDGEDAYPPSTDGFDHEVLAETLVGIDGQFLCSYETVPEPLQRDGLFVATRETVRDLSGGTNGVAKDATEALVANFEPSGLRSQATLAPPR